MFLLSNYKKKLSKNRKLHFAPLCFSQWCVATKASLALDYFKWYISYVYNTSTNVKTKYVCEYMSTCGLRLPSQCYPSTFTAFRSVELSEKTPCSWKDKLRLLTNNQLGSRLAQRDNNKNLEVYYPTTYKLFKRF